MFIKYSFLFVPYISFFPFILFPWDISAENSFRAGKDVLGKGSEAKRANGSLFWGPAHMLCLCSGAGSWASMGGTGTAHPLVGYQALSSLWVGGSCCLQSSQGEQLVPVCEPFWL